MTYIDKITSVFCQCHVFLWPPGFIFVLCGLLLAQRASASTILFAMAMKAMASSLNFYVIKLVNYDQKMAMVSRFDSEPMRIDSGFSGHQKYRLIKSNFVL